MAKKRKGYPNCLNTLCDDYGWYCRGLCRNCYSAAAHLIKVEKTTWEELEEAGKVRPPNGPGRPRSASKFFLSDE